MNNYISLDQIGKRLDLKVNNLIMVNYVPYIVRIFNTRKLSIDNGWYSNRNTCII